MFHSSVYWPNVLNKQTTKKCYTLFVSTSLISMFSALTQIVICQVHETGVQEEKWRVKAGKKGTEHILFES